VRRVDYFSTTVKDQPGEAYQLLTTLADLGINLLAFTAVPIGPLGCPRNSNAVGGRCVAATVAPECGR
jgi:hypothetical protein